MALFEGYERRIAQINSVQIVMESALLKKLRKSQKTLVLMYMTSRKFSRPVLRMPYGLTQCRCCNVIKKGCKRSR